MSLKVGTANVYVGNDKPGAACKVLMAENLDSFGLNEAKNFGQQIDKMSDLYRVTRAIPDNTTASRRGALDTPIFAKKSLPNLGDLTLRISENVPASTRVAPDRWGTVTMYQHALGMVAHINVHLNAAVQGARPGMARVKEYAESIESLDRLLTWLKTEGFLVVLSGDVNWRKDGPDAPHSPYRLIEKHGMGCVNDGLDIVAFDGRLKAISKKLIPPSVTGSDTHDFIIVTLERNG